MAMKMKILENNEMVVSGFACGAGIAKVAGMQQF